MELGTECMKQAAKHSDGRLINTTHIPDNKIEGQPRHADSLNLLSVRGTWCLIYSIFHRDKLVPDGALLLCQATNEERCVPAT